MAKSHSRSANLRTTIRLFGLFGHPARLIIFQRLVRQAATAGELAKNLPISRSAVVQHLKLLEAADLVSSTPAGKRQIYRAVPRGLDPLQVWLDEHLKRLRSS
jgi:DNA-binding transcriptional ArsR family regulator